MGKLIFEPRNLEECILSLRLVMEALVHMPAGLCEEIDGSNLPLNRPSNPSVPRLRLYSDPRGSEFGSWTENVSDVLHAFFTLVVQWVRTRDGTSWLYRDLYIRDLRPDEAGESISTTSSGVVVVHDDVLQRQINENSHELMRYAIFRESWYQGMDEEAEEWLLWLFW